MEVSKTRNIIGWIVTTVPVLALALASFGKLTSNPELVDKLAMLNITNLPLLGAILLACLVLYLTPKTSNIGFFLLCSYVGGVIVGRIAQGESPMIGIGLAALLYIGTMLRKPELSGLDI